MKAVGQARTEWQEKLRKRGVVAPPPGVDVRMSSGTPAQPGIAVLNQQQVGFPGMPGAPGLSPAVHQSAPGIVDNNSHEMLDSPPDSDNL